MLSVTPADANRNADAPARLEAVMTAGELREQVYIDLLRARAVAYPNPPFGHHPNFRGAAQATSHLLDYLCRAQVLEGATVLAYPDYVLRPVRKGLLERGVHVVVPAKYGGGYRFLESGRADPEKGSSIKGAETEGEWLDELPPVSTCFVACVALAETGAWLGKGYGFTLPRHAAGRPAYAIAHPLMVVGTVPETDGVLAGYATPERVFRMGA
jgi:5-formyltetrahydrofolate cyclo-ligase